MAAPTPKDATYVGNVFVRKYYTKMDEQMEDLHLFYHEDSKVTRGNEQHEAKETQQGLEGIKELISSHASAGRKAFLDIVDCQGDEDAILISAVGQLELENNTFKRFVQTFHLVKSDVNRFYVKNDIFRFIPGSPEKPEASPQNTPEPEPVQEPEPVKEPEATPEPVEEATPEVTQEQTKPEPEKAKPNGKAKPAPKAKPQPEPEAAPAEPAKPAGPISWANRVKLSSNNAQPKKQVQAPQKTAPTTSPAKKSTPKGKTNNSKEWQTRGGPKDRKPQGRKSDGQNKRGPRDNSVYVVGLPNELNDTNPIYDLFGQFGKVVDVSLPNKPGTNYCFVQFDKPEAARASANAPKPLTLNGRKLKVEERRRDRPQGASRGDNRRGSDGQREGRRGGPQAPRNKPATRQNRPSRAGGDRQRNRK